MFSPQSLTLIVALIVRNIYCYTEKYTHKKDTKFNILPLFFFMFTFMLLLNICIVFVRLFCSTLIPLFDTNVIIIISSSGDVSGSICCDNQVSLVTAAPVSPAAGLVLPPPQPACGLAAVAGRPGSVCVGLVRLGPQTQ